MEYIRDGVFKVEPSQICGRRPGTKLVRCVTVCLDSFFYHFQFFKSCLSQILLRPFLNAVSFFNYFIQSRYFYAYLMVADLARIGISVHCQVSVRFQYLVSLLSLCWITGVYSVYRPIEGLLPQLVLNSHCFEIRSPRQLDYRCILLRPYLQYMPSVYFGQRQVFFIGVLQHSSLT